MAFIKTADAIVKTPSIRIQSWDDFRDTAVSQGAESLFGARTASFNLKEYTPDRYLLTHSTIIASVDVEEVPNVKTGSSVREGSREIKRLWNDYYITPETSKYINQNADSWDRQTLLNTFRTFIGAENYVEHVQIPELSKGKVIDAVARDLGDTIYIDILVATDRKHASLIADIESGKMNTMSMGCFTGDTPVTLGDGTSRPISEVEVGDEVYTHQGRIRKVQATKKTFWEEDLISLHLVGSADPLKVTHTHPLLVVRPYATCACGCGEELASATSKTSGTRLHARFKNGHRVRVYNPTNSYSEQEEAKRRERLEDIYSVETEWVQAGLLKEKDWLVFPESSVVTKPECTIEDARLMGYYLAEGNVCKNPSGSIYAFEFTFGLPEKDTLVLEVEGLLDRKGLPFSVYEREDRSTVVVRVHDPEYAEWISNRCGQGADKKALDISDLLLWPSDFKKSLIGAYFNGDGTESSNGVISATTVSYQLHQQMRRLLGTLGIRTSEWCNTLDKTVLLHEATKVGRQDNRRLPSYKVSISKSQRYKLEAYTKWDTPTDQRIQDHDAVEGMVLVPISGIEKISHAGTWVYDLQVAEDHSFCVDGYVAHNCSIQFSRCSKCGNVAADDTELCEHVRYEKGNTFLDENGKTRVIAEICGHSSDPESVTFIEASWVANPAFKGAVTRTVLNPTELSNESGKVEANAGVPSIFQASPMVQQFLASQNIDDFLKSASVDRNRLEALHSEMRQVLASDLSKTSFGFDDDEDDGGNEDENLNFIEEVKKEVKEDVEKDIKKKVREEIREEMDLGQKKPEFEGTPEKEDLNDTVIHSFQVFSDRYASELPDHHTLRKVFLVVKTAKDKGWAHVKSSDSYGNREILAALYLKDRDFSDTVPTPEIYDAMKKVGGTRNYRNVGAYLNACSLALGRKVTRKEAKRLISLGKILK